MHNPFTGETELLQPRYDARPFTARVDDDCSLTRFVAEDDAIATERRDGERLDDHAET